MKTNTKTIGDSSEDMAWEYLEKKGYILLERNFLSKYGEIDIVATTDDLLIFVEVKARKNSDYGFPRDFVTPAKQRRILTTSEIYIKENQMEEYQPRYDVMEIYLESGQIEHIENAFP